MVETRNRNYPRGKPPKGARGRAPEAAGGSAAPSGAATPRGGSRDGTPSRKARTRAGKEREGRDSGRSSAISERERNPVVAMPPRRLMTRHAERELNAKLEREQRERRAREAERKPVVRVDRELERAARNVLRGEFRGPMEARLLAAGVVVLLLLAGALLYALGWVGRARQPSPPVSCARALETATFRGTVMEDHAQDLSAHLQYHGYDHAHAGKAMTVVLSGPKAGLARAEKAIQASLPSLCQKKCAVHVDLSEHGMGVPGATAAGAVQEALVRALERCPAEGPVVWLHHALRAHPEVLRGPVHTLTGESGVFHHMGRAVRADRALVFLTVESPDATEADVKSALMGLADGVEGKGLALVRRIDHFVALQ